MDPREKMKQRSRRARENRDKRFGGKAKYSVLDLDAMCRDFGWDEVPWYQVTAGATKNEIDIIMFIITQEWYAKLRAYDGTPTGLNPGDWDYKFEIPVHQRWGGNNSIPLFCRNEGIGGRCPICEDRQAEWDKGKGKSDKAVLQALGASWRCFYNTYDYTNEKYRPWEVAYKSFEEMMQEELDIIEKETGEDLIPWDLSDGRTIEFKGRVKQIGETEYNEPQIPAFLPRDPYEEEILKDMISFDKYLKIPSYEEVCRIYYGVDDEPIEVSEQKEEESQPADTETRTRRRPTRERSSEPETDTRRRGRRSADTGTKVAAETDQAPDDSRCSFGHNFGHDCNKKPECSDECPEDQFDACIDEQDRILKGEAEPEEETRSPRERQRARGGDEQPKTRERKADQKSDTTRRRRKR